MCNILAKSPQNYFHWDFSKLRQRCIHYMSRLWHTQQAHWLPELWSQVEGLGLILIIINCLDIFNFISKILFIQYPSFFCAFKHCKEKISKILIQAQLSDYIFNFMFSLVRPLTSYMSNNYSPTSKRCFVHSPRNKQLRNRCW